MFIICTSIWPLRENFLVAIWQSVSANRVLFWFGLVQSDRRKNVSRNGYPPHCSLVTGHRVVQFGLVINKSDSRFAYDYRLNCTPLSPITIIYYYYYYYYWLSLRIFTSSFYIFLLVFILVNYYYYYYYYHHHYYYFHYYTRIYNKILDRDWFSAPLLVT